jgi:predicted Rossmann fold flavoprotein
VENPIIAQASRDDRTATADLVIVGGGAAGLATAIFAARSLRDGSSEAPTARRIIVVDGARTLGAKILVSGGSRCNVTNARVETTDFWRSGSPFVRQVLRAFPVPDTIAFFEEIGVSLNEEPLGKLFPTTNKSRTVLDALLRESGRLGIEILSSCRALALARSDNEWKLETSTGPIEAAKVVLATGGLSLPKTGSDGGGYVLARELGHTIVPPTPALEPLILGGDFHRSLQGIAHDAAIRVSRVGEKAVVVRGSLLWTHFGVSGPLALDASRFMRRAKVDGVTALMTLSFVPDLNAEDVDSRLLAAARLRPHHAVVTELAREFGLTQAVALRVAEYAAGPDATLARLTREKRLALVSALTAFPLDVVDGRGYNFAEVTSGGVAVEEVNAKTMESRLAPGLYFVGEILDVDGRIGGFNFQWAWSTAKVAGRSIAASFGG